MTGVWLLPWRWRILSIPLKAGRGISAETWVGWCVSSWRPWFWPMYSTYYIHTKHYGCIISNWNKLFLRDMHAKSWCGHAGVLDDLILLLFPVWFHVYLYILYSCIVQYCLYHNMDIGTMWHCTLVSSTPPQSIRLFFGECLVQVLSVIRCSYYFTFLINRILFQHDFHHDHHWDFYDH